MWISPINIAASGMQQAQQRFASAASHLSQAFLPAQAKPQFGAGQQSDRFSRLDWAESPERFGKGQASALQEASPAKPAGLGIPNFLRNIFAAVVAKIQYLANLMTFKHAVEMEKKALDTLG